MGDDFVISHLCYCELCPSKQIFVGLCAIVCILMWQLSSYHQIPFQKIWTHTKNKCYALHVWPNTITIALVACARKAISFFPIEYLILSSMMNDSGWFTIST